jgi:hypothetical protein
MIISDFLLDDLLRVFPDYNILNFPVRGNPQNFVLVMPPQGNPSRYYTNGTYSASIIVQNVDARESLEQATAIYEHYRDQVNYDLGDDETLNINYIQPVDRPVPLGDVGNGRYQYSINLLMNTGGFT